eukprot:9849579-Ditylum_brightwellii.AAC.1
MSSPTFNVAITLEDIVSLLNTWTEQITKEKKVQFVDKSNYHCTLCDVKIKQGEVEICMDCQDVSCNKCVKHCCTCEKTTKCRDCMMVDIDDLDASVWKCDECAYYATQHEEETEERGDY